jgi:hypothetical protein
MECFVTIIHSQFFLGIRLHSHLHSWVFREFDPSNYILVIVYIAYFRQSPASSLVRASLLQVLHLYHLKSSFGSPYFPNVDTYEGFVRVEL